MVAPGAVNAQDGKRMTHFCPDCLRLTNELASATTEATVDQRDQVARLRAGLPISEVSREWLTEARSAYAAALGALRAHKERTNTSRRTPWLKT
jgi:hypothetical protein